MKKVSLCLIVHNEYINTLYFLDKLGFKISKKEEEFIVKQQEITFVKTIYDVEVELLVALKENDKTDYRKMGAKAFYGNKKRNQNPHPLDSPAGIDWDKGWDKAQSAESDSYKGY